MYRGSLTRSTGWAAWSPDSDRIIQILQRVFSSSLHSFSAVSGRCKRCLEVEISRIIQMTWCTWRLGVNAGWTYTLKTQKHVSEGDCLGFQSHIPHILAEVYQWQLKELAFCLRHPSSAWWTTAALERCEKVIAVPCLFWRWQRSWLKMSNKSMYKSIFSTSATIESLQWFHY